MQKYDIKLLSRYFVRVIKNAIV